MAGLLVDVKPDERAGQRQPLLPRRSEWIVLACYLLTAIGLTWRIWAHPASMGPTDGGPVRSDIYLNVWFMRYVATAWSNGHFPAIVTHAVNAPQGINSMWNTSLFVPGTILTPVTLTAGPVVSLAIMLTLGLAGSAASLFLVLRRWGVSLAGATIGGAFYAFMPALLIAAEDHYHMEFAVLPPLIVDASLRLATGRGRPVRVGLWLGLLIAIEIFIAEELLVDTALTAAVLIGILILNRPRQIPDRAAGAVTGFGVAVGTVLVLCGYALFRQFHGPLAEHGSPWQIGKYGNQFSTFVTAPLSVVFHGHYLHYLKTIGLWPVEVYGYLGWPLLIAMIIAPVLFWRDLRIRVTSLSFLFLEWVSLGARPHDLHGVRLPAGLFPFHYLSQLPLLNEIVINRLNILCDGLAGVVLALVTDRVIVAVRRQAEWRKPALAAAACLALVAIVLPLIPRPVPANKIVRPPAGWTSVIRHLHLKAGTPVLVLPFDHALEMEWQATTNEPISVVGGYCVAPDKKGKATQCDNKPLETPAERTTQLRAIWLGYRIGRPGPAFSTFEVALRQWRAGALVIVPGRGQRAALHNYMLAFFGAPTARKHGVLGWRLSGQWWLHLPWQSHAKH